MKKVLTVLSFLASLATASPSLVPMPLEFTETAGSFYLQSGAKILYSGVYGGSIHCRCKGFQ